MPFIARAFDFLVHPQIVNFAFRSALRTTPHEFLDGAQAAAHVVHSAIRNALQNDDKQLAELAESGALSPTLYDKLRDEIKRGREAGDWALEAMEAELDLQTMQLDDGPPRLQHSRLVVGVQRSEPAHSGIFLLRA